MPDTGTSPRGAARLRLVLAFLAGGVALGIAALLALRGGAERSPRDHAPMGDRPAVDLEAGELERAAVPGATEDVGRVAAEADERAPETFRGSRGADPWWPGERFDSVHVAWRLVTDGRTLEPAELHEHGVAPDELVVRVRSLGQDGLGASDHPYPGHVRGRTVVRGSAPVAVALFLRGMRADEVESLGSPGDHDPETKEARLEVALDLPLERLRTEWGRLVVRPADPARRLARLELEDEEGRRRTRRPRPATAELDARLPAGRYVVHALLDDGRVAVEEVELRGGSDQVVVLDPAPPGWLEVVLDVPEELPPLSEVIVYPRDLRHAEVLAEDWSAFGFPSFALRPGVRERLRTPPAPAGAYDVVFRSLHGLGEHTLLPLGGATVTPGATTTLEVELDLTTYVASTGVRVQGVDTADVVVRSVEGAVVAVERMSLRTPLRLPLGSYRVLGRRSSRADLPLGTRAEDVVDVALDVTMAGAEVDLPFRPRSW